MARRHHNRHYVSTDQRDAPRIARDFVAELDRPFFAPSAEFRLPSLSDRSNPWSGRDLLDVEDHRLYQPDRLEYPSTRSPRRWKAAISNRAPTFGPQRFSPQGSPLRAFSLPGNLAVCVRRKRRAEVLHALGKVGRGASNPRRRRNPNSDIRCK